MIKYALLAAILVVSVFGLWLQDQNFKVLQADVAGLKTTTEEQGAQVEAANSALDRVRTQLADALRPKTPEPKKGGK